MGRGVHGGSHQVRLGAKPAAARVVGDELWRTGEINAMTLRCVDKAPSR
jgi:hypothetical protein